MNTPPSQNEAPPSRIAAALMAFLSITPEQASYLRGKRYNREKGKVGGDRKSSRQNDDGKPGRTTERLAEEYKTTAKTIERDGKFAAAVDKLAENHGDDVRRDILGDWYGLATATGRGVGREHTAHGTALAYGRSTATAQARDTSRLPGRAKDERSKDLLNTSQDTFGTSDRNSTSKRERGVGKGALRTSEGSKAQTSCNEVVARASRVSDCQRARQRHERTTKALECIAGDHAARLDDVERSDRRDTPCNLWAVPIGTVPTPFARIAAD